MITEEIPTAVAADPAFRNARQNSDPQNARIEHDRAAWRVAVARMNDEAEFFKHFSDNESFRRKVMDTVFALTYDRPR